MCLGYNHDSYLMHEGFLYISKHSTYLLKVLQKHSWTPLTKLVLLLQIIISHHAHLQRIQLIVFYQTSRFEKYESDCNKDWLKTVNKKLLSPRPCCRKITKKQKELTMTLYQPLSAQFARPKFLDQFICRAPKTCLL